jgi:phenylacetate-CoA ligase
MARIDGRSDDMLIVRGVNLFPTQIEALLLRVPGLSPHYVLEVARVDRLDTLTVKVECSTAAAGDVSTREGLGQQLAALIKSYIGIGALVQVQEPGVLERSAGKARRVIDYRKHQASRELKRAGDQAKE